MCLVCAMLTLVGEGMGVIDDVRTAAPMIVSVMAGKRGCYIWAREVLLPLGACRIVSWLITTALGRGK